MSTIRKINLSQTTGPYSDTNNPFAIMPYGEIGFYVNPSTDALELLMFDGKRTILNSKVFSPGIFYGSNADSGDAGGYDSVKIVPDSLLFYNGSDQYLRIDPYLTGNIHIRAGGLLDNSSTNLILGGQRSHVKVAAGFNPPVSISADANVWVFNANGTITFPDNTVQSTAAAGSSFDQSLNTTDTVNFANVNVAPGGMLMSDVIEDYSGAGLTIQAWRNSRADYVFNGRDSRGDAEILLPSRTYIRNVTGDGGGFVDIESYKSITNKTDDSFSQGATYLEPYSFVIDIDHAATTGPRSTWRFDTDGLTFPDGYIQTTAYRRNETVKFQNFGSGVEVLDCGVVNGYATIFRYANLTGNLTANLTNLNFDGASRAMSVSVIITQGATPYVCNAVQIEGVAQTVLWQGSASAPTGNANKTDIITFSIVRTGLNSTDYIVLGQLVSFG